MLKPNRRAGALLVTFAVLSPALLLCRPSHSSEPKRALLLTAPAPAAIEMRYFRDVVSQKHPVARYEVRPVAGMYSFYDHARKTQFRDLAQIRDSALKLSKSASVTPRAGYRRYVWSTGLRRAEPGLKPVYLTAAERRQADALNVELTAYNALISRSPLIVGPADIQRPVSANWNRCGLNRAGLRSLCRCSFCA